MNRLLGNTRMTQIFPTEQGGDKPVAVNWDESLEHMELRFTLDNNPNLIQPLVSYLCERATAFGLCEATLEKHLAIALEEALLNALYHGNLELSSADLREGGDELLSQGNAASIARRQRDTPYCQRQIHVRAMLSSNAAEFVIRDEGPGFDYAVCTPLVIDDGELCRPTGRGLMLMYSFMDEVRFNAEGNEVTMLLRRDAA
jgi:anti-sigma regulatory factor (Ser/Thr protein kinase)